MSDIEKFYYAICAKFGVTKKWEEIHPMQQMQFVQAINMIFAGCAMTKRFTQEDILGGSGFRLLWLVDDYIAEVKVYKISGHLKDDTILFGNSWDKSENTQDVEPYLTGYVKWDGCTELNQGKPHWCGGHGFGYHILLLQHIFHKAPELMGLEPEDDWQLDIKIKDEFKGWYE